MNYTETWNMEMPLIKIKIMQGDLSEALVKLTNLIEKDNTLSLFDKGEIMQNIYFTFCTYLKSLKTSISENNCDHFLVTFANIFNIKADLELFRANTEKYYEAESTIELDDDVATLAKIIHLGAPLRLKCYFLNKFINLVPNEITFYEKYKNDFDYAVKEINAYYEGMRSRSI